jgi:hypothetical protein
LLHSQPIPSIEKILLRHVKGNRVFTLKAELNVEIGQKHALVLSSGSQILAAKASAAGVVGYMPGQAAVPADRFSGLLGTAVAKLI